MFSIPRSRLMPLILAICIIIVDQLTKLLIVRTVEPYYLNRFSIEVIGDFLRIIHTRNTAAAFSIGSGLPDLPRKLLFTLLPLAIVIGIVIYYFRNNDLTQLQRWAIAGIIGGGTGNLIDRLFRSLGVIDFIDVRFYGILGMERWPTFNVADSSVVVGGILLSITLLVTKRRQ